MTGQVQVDAALAQDRLELDVAEDLVVPPLREGPQRDVAEHDPMAEATAFPRQQTAQPFLLRRRQVADVGGIDRDEQHLTDPEGVAERVIAGVDEFDPRPPRRPLLAVDLALQPESVSARSVVVARRHRERQPRVTERPAHPMVKRRPHRLDLATVHRRRQPLAGDHVARADDEVRPQLDGPADGCIDVQPRVAGDCAVATHSHCASSSETSTSQPARSRPRAGPTASLPDGGACASRRSEGKTMPQSGTQRRRRAAIGQSAAPAAGHRQEFGLWMARLTRLTLETQSFSTSRGRSQ